jgi:hypothetical protein
MSRKKGKFKFFNIKILECKPLGLPVKNLFNGLNVKCSRSSMSAKGGLLDKSTTNPPYKKRTATPQSGISQSSTRAVPTNSFFKLQTLNSKLHFNRVLVHL